MSRIMAQDPAYRNVPTTSRVPNTTPQATNLADLRQPTRSSRVSRTQPCAATNSDTTVAIQRTNRSTNTVTALELFSEPHDAADPAGLGVGPRSQSRHVGIQDRLGVARSGVQSEGTP